MMIGRKLNHYEILGALGSGGMGEVYLARDTKLQREVALKVLASELAGDAERRSRFEREARAVAALNHPNIVTIHSVEEAEGTHFITMELVRGKTLSELIPPGGLPLGRLFRLAIPLADAVSAAHERGITHRDLKPANVMLGDDGRLKILDFGLAKLREESATAAAETQLPTQSITQEGHILGTVAYMSPEQAEGKPVDHRSDLFSLGIILFEMATGEKPFKGDTKISLMSSIIKDDPPSVTDLNRVAPRHLARIVGQCLHKDPSRRLQSALDLRNALEGLKEEVESGETSSVGVKEETALPRSGSRLPYWLVGLGLVVAFIAYGAYLSVGWLKSVPGTASSALTESTDNSLAVLYFENVADPDDTSRMERMTPSLLITALSQSPDLKVVSRQRLHDILNQLGRDDAGVIDRSIGTDVARSAKVRWIVTGEVLQEKPNLVLTAEIAEARSGSILASTRVMGDQGEDVFSVVDRLSAELRKELAPSRGASSRDVPLSGVTTGSPEAYRHYLDGLDFYYKWYMPEAAASFEKAIELDPKFAMAHYWLSVTPGTEDPKRHIELAMENLDRVGEKDRHFIRSWDARLLGRYKQAIAELNAIVEADPDDKEAHYRLGRIHWIDLWDTEGGERHLSRVVELDPRHKAAWNVLAYVHGARRQPQRAIQAIDRYLELAPGEANPYDSRGEILLMTGQLEQAARSFEQALRIKPDLWISLENLGHVNLWMGDYREAERHFRALVASDESEVSSWGRSGLNSIPLHQGKLGRALELLDQGVYASNWAHRARGAASSVHSFKAQIHETRGELEQAVVEAEAAVTAFDLGHIPNPHRAHLVYLLGRSGNFADAEAELDRTREEVEAFDGVFDWRYAQARGMFEWTRGNLPEAARQLEAANPRLLHPGPALGAIYLEMGEAERAVSRLEQDTADYLFREEHLLAAIRAVYVLGVAYEETGRTGEAMTRYEAFLEKWKDADPGIPEVEDARTRLDRLESETR